MPDTISWSENRLFHSNFAYAVYDGSIIGRLDEVRFMIEKDAEYDVIIGSGGKPFGHPLQKFTKFKGTFKKGWIKASELDKFLILDSVGNSHADYFGAKHDETDFATSNVTKFIDMDTKSLTLFPASFSNVSISFGGVVITKHEIIMENNKFIAITGEFIGQFVEFHDTLSNNQYQV